MGTYYFFSKRAIDFWEPGYLSKIIVERQRQSLSGSEEELVDAFCGAVEILFSFQWFWPYSKKAFQKQMKWSYLTPGTTLADQQYRDPRQQGGTITRAVS